MKCRNDQIRAKHAENKKKLSYIVFILVDAPKAR